MLGQKGRRYFFMKLKKYAKKSTANAVAANTRVVITANELITHREEDFETACTKVLVKVLRKMSKNLYPAARVRELDGDPDRVRVNNAAKYYLDPLGYHLVYKGKKAYVVASTYDLDTYGLHFREWSAQH